MLDPRIFAPEAIDAETARFNAQLEEQMATMPQQTSQTPQEIRDAREAWEHEVLVRHRWGQHGDRAPQELAPLRKLYKRALPMSQPCTALMEQIIALEICNWNLEESILALCTAIGKKEPAKWAIGHLASVSEERWKDVWAYYLALRNWLPGRQPSGYQSLLTVCDPDKTTRNRIVDLLGDRDELKELYVERFCLCLEFWLGGYPQRKSAQMKAHAAAVLAIEEEIKERDPEGQILKAMESEGDGRLQPCHHKSFRRYDIIISSIGAGRWRAVMPMRGTDGFERSATLEKFLSPIQSWIHAPSGAEQQKGDKLSGRIHALLGNRDGARVFLASLLVSLLRSQQLAARKRADASLTASQNSCSMKNAS